MITSGSTGSNPVSSARICDYGCDGIATVYFKSTNRWCCSPSCNACPAKRERDAAQKRGKNPFEGRTHPRGNLGKGEKLRGKPLSVDHRARISKSLTGLSHPANVKAKISKSLCSNPNVGGYRTRSGRSKFHGSYYANVWMDSSWETLLAQQLDQLHIRWVRGDAAFLYIDNVGKQRKYHPDFFLPDFDVYLEVKGYWTDLVRHKIKDAQQRNSFRLIILDSLDKILAFNADVIQW